MALWRVRATVDDRPGYLSVLTASLALRSVNILSVQVHATEAGAVDDFLVDAPDSLTEADLLAAVAKGRGRDAWVGRTDVRGLVDTQTQLLGVATRLVREPDDLGAALAGLVSGGTVSWSPGDCPAGRDFEEGVMRLPDPAGGTLLVRRGEPPFTPAEFARAHALVDLAAAVLEQAGHRWQLLLPDGDELTVRLAGLQDAEAVAALCAGRRASAGAARRLAAPGNLALLAETEPSGVQPSGAQPSGRVVAVAGIHRDGTEAQVDLLVTEAYRRRGVGSALLRRAARLAAGSGVEALHAHACQPDGVALARAMGRLGYPVRQVVDGPMLTLTADLRPGATDPVPPATRPVEPGVTG